MGKKAQARKQKRNEQRGQRKQQTNIKAPFIGNYEGAYQETWAAIQNYTEQVGKVRESTKGGRLDMVFPHISSTSKVVVHVMVNPDGTQNVMGGIRGTDSSELALAFIRAYGRYTQGLIDYDMPVFKSAMDEMNTTLFHFFAAKAQAAA